MIHSKLSNRGRNAFTLVELLAVIVILAIILVIAVPKVMSIINDSKKSTFSASVKLIASSAEQRYTENKALGNNDKITCESIAKLSSSDYKLCEITFEQDKARVTVIGDGKFDGLSVVYASKTNAEVQEGAPERLYTFDDLYNIIDELKSEVEILKSQNGDNNDSETIENLQSQINENKNKITEHDNKINDNVTSIINLTNKDNDNNVFLQTYPVGSIYVTNDSTNPGTKFGGTWVSYGSGRTLVGVDSSQEEFATVGFTGGEKTHTLTVGEMPSHSHYVGFAGVWDAVIDGWAGTATGKISISHNGLNSGNENSAETGHAFATGGSQAHNNLQPYITVYMWKRTA